MSKTWKLLLLTLLVSSLAVTTAGHVKAQQYANINSEILPSEGGPGTTIILRFTTTSPSVSSVQTADIFWDNNSIAPLDQPGTPGANGAYNYNITVPTEPPLSTQGNHTIRVDSTVTPYGPVSFSFTFNISEFVPSPEYIVLNATYYSLLANYTNILGNYTQLTSSYSQLSANYTTLLAQHNNDTLNYNTLISQYNVLNSNYNSLSANYNLLSVNYANLTTTYVSLSSDYAYLQTNLQALSSNYSMLLQDYNLLNSSYAGLLSNYNNAIDQLNLNRDLNYFLIIVTIILAITTVYFVIIRPKRLSRTR